MHRAHRIPRSQRAQPKALSRGAELGHKTTSYIPADCTIRPLRDEMVIEPIEQTLSAIIHVIHEQKPVRGIVRAIGPGRYPWKYNGRKSQRTQAWLSKNFRPTEVKVGQTVELDPNGYQGLSFYWGEKLMLMAREESVCGIHPDA